MELLKEIRKLKSPVRFRDTAVGNPLPYVERALKEIQEAFANCCRLHGISYAEFLETMERRHPALCSRYWRLADTVDCDVFGRWCDATLTANELRVFIELVEQWKVCAREMTIAFESENNL